jgi:hypothetical protein
VNWQRAAGRKLNLTHCGQQPQLASPERVRANEARRPLSRPTSPRHRRFPMLATGAGCRADHSQSNPGDAA